MKAWRNACDSPSGSEVVVPENKVYHLKPITFSGPCKPNFRFKVCIYVCMYECSYVCMYIVSHYSHGGCLVWLKTHSFSKHSNMMIWKPIKQMKHTVVIERYKFESYDR